MGEVVDLEKDFTSQNLTLTQKLSVVWGAIIGESKILGRMRKDESNKEQKQTNINIDMLRNGIIASLTYHLQENATLAAHNQIADTVMLAIDRKYVNIISAVLEGSVFNSYDVVFVPLDVDLVSSFGNEIPIIISFRQKEITI